MGSFRTSQIDTLREYVVEKTREFVPPAFRDRLQISNYSTPRKLHLIVKIGPLSLLQAITRAGKFVTSVVQASSAQEGISPCFMTPKTWINPLIGEQIKTVIEQRMPQIEDGLALIAKLDGDPGINVKRNSDGSIRLIFEHLTPEAYDRIVKTVLPITPTRFGRNEPL